MSVPLVAARVEEGCAFSGWPIDSDKVGSLVKITVKTRQREIGGTSWAVVFASNDMFNVQRHDGSVRFRQATIFTARLGPAANEISELRVHRRAEALASTALALD